MTFYLRSLKDICCVSLVGALSLFGTACEGSSQTDAPDVTDTTSEDTDTTSEVTDTDSDTTPSADHFVFLGKAATRWPDSQNLEGLSVTALDNPDAGAVLTAADGSFAIAVPRDRQALIRVEGEGYVPRVFVFPAPLDAPPMNSNLTFEMVTLDDLTAIYGAFVDSDAPTPEAGRAHLKVLAGLGDDSGWARGMTVHSDAATTFYLPPANREAPAQPLERAATYPSTWLPNIDPEAGHIDVDIADRVGNTCTTDRSATAATSVRMPVFADTITSVLAFCAQPEGQRQLHGRVAGIDFVLSELVPVSGETVCLASSDSICDTSDHEGRFALVVPATPITALRLASEDALPVSFVIANAAEGLIEALLPLANDHRVEVLQGHVDGIDDARLETQLDAGVHVTIHLKIPVGDLQVSLGGETYQALHGLDEFVEIDGLGSVRVPTMSRFLGLPAAAVVDDVITVTLEHPIPEACRAEPWFALFTDPTTLSVPVHAGQMTYLPSMECPDGDAR